MNALDALLPHHALFHKAAAAASGPRAVPARSIPSVKSVPSMSKEPKDRFRKYIITEHEGREHAHVFPLSLQHDKACPQAAGRLVSAGSFGIANGRVVLTGMGSGTLNLNSRPQDAELIQSLFSES